MTPEQVNEQAAAALDAVIEYYAQILRIYLYLGASFISLEMLVELQKETFVSSGMDKEEAVNLLLIILEKVKEDFMPGPEFNEAFSRLVKERAGTYYWGCVCGYMWETRGIPIQLKCPRCTVSEAEHPRSIVRTTPESVKLFNKRVSR